MACVAAGVFAQGTNRPGGDAGNFPFLQKIEARMGRSLTNQERMQFFQATKTWVSSMNAAVDKFARKLTEITGVPYNDTKAMMPQFGKMTEPYKKDVIPQLEAKLGRKLTQEEMQKIMAAYKEKEAATKPLIEQYVGKLTSLTGLTEKDIKELLHLKD
jgi:hypothetical protein